MWGCLLPDGDSSDSCSCFALCFPEKCSNVICLMHMTCVVPNWALDTWKKKVLSGMLKYHMDTYMYQFFIDFS